MWNGGSSHGFLFLSRRPWVLPTRLNARDVQAALVDVLRCLAYAHHKRNYFSDWRAEFAGATDMEVCSMRAAMRGNAAPCIWTAAAYSNYAWMCMVGREIAKKNAGALCKDSRHALAWLTLRIPFETKIELPTVFPGPPRDGEHAAPANHDDAVSAARRYYKRLQTRRPKKPQPRPREPK